MNIWNKIDEPIMRAIGNVVYSIWGCVGFSIDYNEEKKEIKLVVFDRSYKCEDKKIEVEETFNYEIQDATVSTKLEIVEMIEKYLITNFS